MDFRIELDFSTPEYRYFEGHRINGDVVVPAATLITTLSDALWKETGKETNLQQLSFTSMIRPLADKTQLEFASDGTRFTLRNLASGKPVLQGRFNTGEEQEDLLTSKKAGADATNV